MNGAPTITRTVIVNSQNSVSAASPQVLNGIEYLFASWSDGSTSAARTIVAPASPWSAPLRATYLASSADLDHKGRRARVERRVGRLDIDGGERVWRSDRLERRGDGHALDEPRAPVFDAPGWTCSYAGGTRTATCTLRSLAAGSTSPLRFTTPVVARKANRADNTAGVASATRDVSTGDNSSTTTIRLR